MSHYRIRDLRFRLCAPVNRWYAFRRLAEYHSKPRTVDEIVDWAMNFGDGGYFAIKATQIPFEIATLAKRVQELDPKVILEIGTSRGGTLLIWAALASTRVITCDLRDFSLCGIDKLFKALPPPTSNCKVDLLSGDSHSPIFRDRVARTLSGQKVDFLFIDGDHTAIGVSQDYNNYQDFVRPGGLIAFHDIVERQPLPENQVSQFWRINRNTLDVEEIIQDRNQTGFGIGLVHVT